MSRAELLEHARIERAFAAKCIEHAEWLHAHAYRVYATEEYRVASDALARATAHEHSASLSTEPKDAT